MIIYSRLHIDSIYDVIRLTAAIVTYFLVNFIFRKLCPNLKQKTINMISFFAMAMVIIVPVIVGLIYKR